MGFHTFDADRADKLEDAAKRYRFCSREELLGMLSLTGEETVADLGSGTGFYADDVAPHVGLLHAFDVQAVMHDHYREKGVPAGVELVTADVADLPFDDGGLDAAYSTVTFHEFASAESLRELARVLTEGARLVVVDWSGTGAGEEGPPVDERYDAAEAVEMLEDAGFDVVRADDRVETFAVVAERR